MPLELGIQEEMARVHVMGAIMGMVDSAPSYRINQEALAKCLNMRLDRMELGTSPGRAKVNATAMNGAADTDGMGWGFRTDGTEDMIVATNGGYWKVDGDTKTLLSFVDIGNLSLVSATKVSGCSGSQFTGRVSAGDLIWLSGHNISAAQKVSVVSSDSHIVLVSAYGTISSGILSCICWDKQATGKTRIRMFMNRWFFVNGTQKPFEWDPGRNEFREVGLPSAAGVSATMSAGDGSMASATYGYKVCWRDAHGAVGMPSSVFSASLTGAENTMKISFPSVRAEILYADIYRTSAGGTSAFYFLASAVAVSGASGAGSYYDETADSGLTTTVEPPIDNYQPPTAAEDFLVHRDRIIWFKGPRAYIGGLDPTDPHAGSFGGRYQPEYQPSRQWWLGRDKGEQPQIMGAGVLNGRVYAGRSRSTWTLMDRSANPNVWEWVQILPNVGWESRWAVGNDGTALYWLGRKAGRLTVVRYDGFPRFIGDSMRGTLDEIISASEVAGGCSNGYYRLSFSGSEGDREMEWQTDRGDTQSGTWAVRDWRHLCYADAEGTPYGGGSGGFVYQLDTGRHDATGNITRQIDTPAYTIQGEYPVYWDFLQIEIESETAICAISGWMRFDGGSWKDLSACDFPLSAAAASAWIHRRGLPAADWAYGRRPELRLKSAASAEDYKLRSWTLKGRVDRRESV